MLESSVSSNKLKLFELLLTKRGIARKVQEIKRRDASKSCPLSFAQQRLWFLDQLEPNSSLYNLAAAVRLTGELNATALEQSLSEIVVRHETLRTTFSTVDSQPVQVISAPQALALPVVDISAQQEEVRRLAWEEAAKPFDLETGPLLRAQLLRLSEGEHVLLLTMHHIVSDGWSMGVLVRELCALYEAFSQDGESPLAPLAVQYADYAQWQREHLVGELLEQQLEYWREQLAGAPALLELPADHPRPAVQSFRGARESVRLGAELTRALKELSRAEGVTLFMTLLAGFAVLLWRYTGQRDVVVGTPVANRGRREVESLIGFFVNTLSLRLQVAGEESFAETLQRVREVCLGGYAHQEVPFERVVEELGVERRLSQSPLFQVMFALQNAPLPALQLSGLAVELLEVEVETAKFDLTVSLHEGELSNDADRIAGGLTYNTDLFEAATIKRLWHHYQQVLESVVRNPNVRLLDIELLSRDERRQQLEEWNATEVEYLREACLPELFEAQVDRTPDALALVYKHESLTFAELNERTNKLAHYLRKHGVKPETLVGLCIERSPEMIIGLLAILKAGGAYVPLDPTYPKKRLSFMLTDAELSILLTQERLTATLPEHQAKVICLDRDWQTIADENVENPRSGLAPDNLAYVIYTSGSTGRPKGVQVFHRGLANLSVALNHAIYSYYEGPLNVGLNAPLSFDASVKQLLTLASGHTLHVVPDEIRYDVDALSSYIHSNALDVLDCTPSQLSALLNNRGRAVPRIVLCGGEAINEQLWLTLLHTSETDFYNVYGPTECTVDAAIGRVRLSNNRPSIGRPVANTQIYILDQELQPVAVGVSGELYISGAGVARGYLHQPELTAERFLPHPFSREGGARLYRTGDLGRYRANGEIEYLGRVDQQVKVRGYRIELGEVEQVLCEQAGVRQAAVVVRESEQVGQQLVAYVCGEAAAAVSGAELRERVREKLPEYMVPQAIVVVEELPLLPNGKVDRQRLQELEVARAEVRQGPRTAVEELLCGIWAEVLGVEQVGVEEDFFELGGHSLLATQVMSRVREVFGVEVPLRRLFEFSNVAGLAQTVSTELQQGSAKLPEIEPAPNSAEPVLSFAQHRLWFLNHLQPESAAYNMPIAVRMLGRLDVAALQQSVNEIVRRHEAVRTIFRDQMGHPVPVISEAQDVEISVIDLSSLAEEERNAEMLRRARREARLPFDLAHGPLLRTTLLRLSDEEHVFLVTLHHIIFDGWSLGVFMREMAALYEGFLTERPARLPELPIQYQSYAHWQREWLNGEILKTQLDYWKKQLAGAPPVLELPADRPRPMVQSFRGALKTVQFSRQLTAKLGDLSRHENVTLFMTLAAAFQTLLHRYTRQTDICIGVPIANRNRSETEALIGFFVNTLVFRTDLSGNPTFKALLRRVREIALEAYAHQDVPFEMLVEELQPERNLGHTPLFQVVLVLQNARDEKLELPGLSLVPLEIDPETAKFDLIVSLTEAEEGLRCAIEYSTDLFDGETIERLAAHYENLLNAIVAQPETAIDELPLLSAGERRQQLEEWNQTAVEFEGGLVHEWFEQQVRRTPDAVALVYDNDTLSYAELNARANQLAHYLRRRGVGPESLVGVLMERSLEMIVGLLGVLKAGAAYVPLDPDYPAERLAYMLSDTGTSVVLTQERLIGALPEQQAAQVICVDQDWDEIERESAADQASGAGPDNLAYVIYTSGSTGRPKGVVVTHQNVCRLFSSTRQWFDFNATDVWTLFHSFAFDFSVWEIWGALLFGGRLVIVPFWISRSPDEFYSLLIRERVTVLNQTPSAFRQLQQAEARMLEAGSGVVDELALRFVIFGGEALDTASLADWFARHGEEQPQLINMYGITETTVHVTYRPIGMEDVVRASVGSVIGGGIPDLQVYVLDEFQQLVPAGVTGELYVGGAGVARVYLNRPELTAERFVPDGLSGRPGRRLYRSGDLAHYRPNGDLEYMGRGDEQVKVRGYRIELGEVEQVLCEQAGVRQAAVVVRESAQVGQQMVAYVCGEAAAAVSGAELRERVREKLPEYMVPQALVVVEELPLLPNGKVDRQRLQELEVARAAVRQGPRTAVEELLCGIWAEVLGVEQVGVEEDFFELGGHSLLATQVMSRVREVFGVEVPLRRFFEFSNVARLAQAVSTELQQGSAKLPEIKPAPDSAEPVLSFAQQRLWFLNHLQPESAAYNIPIAVRMLGRLDVAALQQSVNEIVRRHEAVRTIFRDQMGHPVPVICEARDVEIPIIDLSSLAEEERNAEMLRRARREARLPFDLAHGPLLRTSLLRLSDEEHVFLVTLHHIIFDGWSLGVFMREMAALYEGFLTERPARLPELPIQYQSYAHWQREWLNGEILKSQLDYWKKQLAGAPPVLELPADRPRPLVQSFRGALKTVQFSRQLTAKLGDLSRHENVTLFMTLAAAFQTLLHRYTRQTDICIGVPIANRNRSETEALIGFFVNTLVFRTDLSGNPTFKELLRRVREIALEAYAHQDVPFEMLVEELQPERNLSHTPLFQVMFVLQNARDEKLELPGLRLVPLEIDPETAKFDLIVSLTEAEEGLRCAIEYSTDLFDGETIERLAAHYENLLNAIVAQPETAIDELPLLSAGERRQQLEEWNGVPSDHVEATCVHELFEQQVRRTPDAVALVYHNDTLSYAELNARANQLAHYLRRHGVGPESLVGVLMERSLEMIVGLLGVLKAGAAYVPLDPAYPHDRLSFMVADAKASVLLTQESLLGVLPEQQAKAICLDRDGVEIERESAADQESGAGPDNLAYVIYTSGSTGRPKGVVVSHQNVCRLFSATRPWFDFNATDVWTLFHSFAFDFSVWEIWGALLFGGRLVIVPFGISRSPDEFYSLLIREGVTVLNQTPSAFRQLQQAEERMLEAGSGVVEDLALRFVIFGGEALDTASLADWFARHGEDQPQLINMYGITETTVHVTYRSIRMEDVVRASVGSVIGRGIPDLQVYVLDEFQQLVPAGVTGELYVGGEGVARVYLNRPELTAERFVPDGLSGRPGGRLYRSGDLARYRPNGDLEYMGRGDEQVKVRGFRIELGEIEAVLNGLAGVRQCVVIARAEEEQAGGQRGEKRLVAYVVTDPEQPVTVNELRHYLKDKLPDYMVPQEVMVLEQLPLSPNGKVDRKRLPEVELVREDTVQVEPRDLLELELLRIWEEVLGVERVGVQDDFFELGGHSLLAVRLIARIQQTIGYRVPVELLLQQGTVERVASFLRHEAGAAKTTSLVAIQPKGKKPALFFVHPVGGNVICYANLVRQLGDERPFYAFQSHGLFGEPLNTIEEMAARYISEMRRVQDSGPYLLGGWSMGGLVAFEMAQQLIRQGDQVSMLAMLDTALPQAISDDISKAGDNGLLRSFFLDLIAPSDGNGNSPLHERPELEGDELFDFLLQKVRAAKLLPPGIEIEQIVRLYELFKSNLRALRSYRPQAGTAPISLAIASERRSVLNEPQLGWDKVARQLRADTLPGNHYTMLRPPHVTALAQWLETQIDEATSSTAATSLELAFAEP